MKKLFSICLIIFQCLHLNAQISVCDSVSYTIVPAQAFSVTLDVTPGLSSAIDSMDILWSVCNTSICYTATGTPASFPNILQTDTVKACYDVYIYIDSMNYFCNVCDSLLHDGNSWGLFISGCMDTAACNYNPLSTENDGVQLNVRRTFSGQVDGYKKKSPLASTPASQYSRPW